MPLVSNSRLPAIERIQEEGGTVVPREAALQQDIRELHIGLLNMMPDAALTATERQFFRLVGESNQIAQFYMHPFTLDELARGPEGRAHVEQYYESFDRNKADGLDALIITGANVTQPDHTHKPNKQPHNKNNKKANENNTTSLCSCLATHAVMQFRYHQKRRHLGFKRWGVFSHRVMDAHHPLVQGVNTRFDVPHSRFNDVSRAQFEAAGLEVLVESKEAGVHLAVSEDLFRLVFFQGHPEYDTISLFKDYKREVARFLDCLRADYPPFPQHYFSRRNQAILDKHREHQHTAHEHDKPHPDQPEAQNRTEHDNTWHDTAEAGINNWIGKVYQITNQDRRRPFMAGIDPDDPLGLRAS